MSEFAWGVVKVGAALGFGLNLAAVYSWVERKQSALMQDRVGANRAEILGFRVLGLFHILSDTLKMITKEDFTPPAALKPWHALAPVLSLTFSLVCLAALPYGGEVAFHGRVWSLQPLPLPGGIVFVLAMLSIGVHGIVMAGYASGSKYAMLGGLRGAAQMISYEVAMLTALAGPLFMYGTLDLNAAVVWQGRHYWGIALQPVAFILFLTAGAAETKRAPFDLPEGEAEIVGYFTEYSGMKFAMFMMNDFIESIVLAGLVVTLFLGGWQVPGLQGNGPAVAAVQVLAFVLKLFAVLWLLMQIRWTLPRFRFDQLLDLGWKNLLPLALLNTLVTAWVVYGMGG